MTDFSDVPDFRGNMELSALPVHSMCRFAFDMTPIVSTGVFAGTKVPQNGTLDVQAFSYGLADANASGAGFGTKTKPTVRHTNLQQAYKVPYGGRMAVETIAFKPEGLISQPTVALPAADPNDVVNDTLLTQQFVDDFKAGTLFSFALRLLESCYAPYVQYGASGAKKYLPALSFLAPGRFQSDGRVTSHQGAPFVMSVDGGIEWSDNGDRSNLIVGAEMKRNYANQAWIATGPTAQLFTDISASLGVLNTGAPAAGAWVFNLDATWILMGYRKAPLNLGR